MNILQIVTLSYPCGTVHHVLMTATELTRRGHQVTVVCPAQGWLRTQLEARGIPLVGLATRPAKRVQQIIALAQQVRRDGIQVIHTHTTRATYIGLAVAQVARVPIVATLHSLTHDLVYRRLLPRKPHRMLAVSDALRQTLIEQKVPAGYVQTVYNGTDFLEAAANLDRAQAARFVRAELALPTDAPLVGLVGDIGKEKGHPLLLEAVPAILAACPLAQFVFVGHIHVEAHARLLQTARSMKVTDHLHFLGVRHDMARLLAAFDVLTIPSEWETFGMVAIEAMAVGTPVVAAHVGGLSEIIVQEQSGVLVARDPSSFAQAVIALLHDPSRRARISRAAQCRVQERFSVSTMVGNVEAIYGEVSQSRQPVPADVVRGGQA